MAGPSLHLNVLAPCQCAADRSPGEPAPTSSAPRNSVSPSRRWSNSRATIRKASGASPTGTGRHFAQFHRDTAGQDRRRDTRTESALVFVEAGLRRGDRVLVIAGADQRDRLFERLASGEFRPESLRDPGQLSVLDAEQITAQFVADSLPEWALFRNALA